MLAERASEQFFLQICTYRYPKYSAECQRFCSKMVDRISACLLPGRTDIVICVEKVAFSTQITNRLSDPAVQLYRYSCTAMRLYRYSCTAMQLYSTVILRMVFCLELRVTSERALLGSYDAFLSLPHP